jgi:hypothetical protein
LDFVCCCHRSPPAAWRHPYAPTHNFIHAFSNFFSINSESVTPSRSASSCSMSHALCDNVTCLGESPDRPVSARTRHLTLKQKTTTNKLTKVAARCHRIVSSIKTTLTKYMPGQGVTIRGNTYIKDDRQLCVAPDSMINH